MNYYTMRDDVASIKTNCVANIVKMTEMNLLIGKKFAKSTVSQSCLQDCPDFAERMKRKALRVRSDGSIPPYVTEAKARKQHSDSPLCNSLMRSLYETVARIIGAVYCIKASLDHSTIRRFRLELVDKGLMEKLFKLFNKQLQKHGIMTIKEGGRSR